MSNLIKNLVHSNHILNRFVTNYIGRKIAKEQYEAEKEQLDKLLRFKDIHLGKRCFIIGTGPSLATADLENLNGEICFASNRIFEIFPQTSWRPTYYMNQDMLLIEKFASEIRELKAVAKFVPIDAKKFFKESIDFDYFVLRHKEYYPKQAEFSTNLCKYLGQGFTVTYGAIQMAHWMGFKEVYLLGIDHNYSISLDEKGHPVFDTKAQDYFAGSKASNKGLNLPRIAESTIAYYTAQAFVKDHDGFFIYNATRGGKLEAFPRKALEDILAK